jgi:hypothetical protein
MASVGSTSVSSSATLVQSNTTAQIYNISMTLANTEYSLSLPVNCKGFLVRNRSGFVTQFSYSSGTSGTVYVTLLKGTVFSDSNYYTSQTIYFQSPSSGGVLEVITYS